jgi:acyl carrier protein
MPSAEPLSFDEFCQLIADELQLDLEMVKPEASFVEDLMVDSIRMVDLLLRLEEMGISFPVEAIWDVHTVEDAYCAYTRAAQAGDQAPSEVHAE